MTGGERWLQRFAKRPDAALRLVCFPHGGGSALFYRSWARRMPDEIELVAVQYPGRFDRLREPRIDAMEPMADAIAGVLAREIAEPFALFGHSMGAAIAFETALRLDCDHDRRPLQLFVSGRKGPTRHRAGRRHLAATDDMLAYVRFLGGSSAALFDTPEVQSFVLPILRSDFKLSETWKPTRGSAVLCPITAYVGDRDPEAPVDAVAAWEHSTTAHSRLRVFPGNHFYLLDHEPEVVADVVGGLAGAL
jgi:pyochelin biosynthetic protein PchC